MYKPLTHPYYLTVEQCGMLESGEAYLKYPSNLDEQSKVGKGIFTLLGEPQSKLVMQQPSKFNPEEVAKVRLSLKRKAKKKKQAAKKSKFVVKEDISSRKEKRHVGDILMVKVLTSLVPLNHGGKTVHLIPQGLTVPAIRTLRGAKLLLSEGRTYEAFKHKFEFGELGSMAVSVGVLKHKAVLGLGIKSKLRACM